MSAEATFYINGVASQNQLFQTVQDAYSKMPSVMREEFDTNRKDAHFEYRYADGVLFYTVGIFAYKIYDLVWREGMPE